MDISEIHERLGQDPLDPKAVEALQNTLISDGDAPGLNALHTIVWERHDPEIALEGVLRTAEVKARTCGDDAVAGMLYARLGLLHWQKMENTDKAELYFRRVAGRAPEHEAQIREFYVDFYARRGNWRRLEQFLMEAAGSPTDNAEILPIKRDLARRAMNAGQPQKSISFWAAVLEMSPEDVEAEDTLFGLYHEVQKWHGLIDLMKKRMERLDSEDIEGKVAICHQMIAIYRDHIRSDTKVNKTWSQILELDPGNSIALEALVEQYEKMQRWPDLVRVLQQKISHAEDNDALLELHRRIALIMMERFSNSAEAIKSYNSILELAPHDLEAMGHLKTLHEKRRDYANYLLIARREVSLEEDSERQSERFVELARIATEKIRKPEVAIELWQEVLSLHTDHPEALEALEGLFERERDYTSLVDILERRLTIEEDDAVRAPLLDKLGLVLSTRIGDANRAAGVFKELLELQPENRKAQNELRKRALAHNDWEELEWLYRNHGTLTELVRTLETRVRGVEEQEEKKRLLFKIADLHREELDEPHRAVSALEQILALDPRNGRAAGRLAPLYSASERWAKLTGVLEIQLGETTDGSVRHDLLVQLTDLYENRLGQYEQAFFSWVQVHRERFDDSSTQDELERLAERSDNWDTWVAVVEETLPRMDDSGMRVATRMRLATILRDTLEETDRALRHHQEIIAEDPAHAGALNAMEDIYRNAGEWNFLIGVLKRKEELTEDPATSRDLCFQIGTTWRDQLGNNQEAAAVFRTLMERSPEDARVLRELSAIYLMEEDYEGLLGILRTELSLLVGDVTTPPSVIAEVHCQIGQLLYSQGHPADQVVDQYRLALEADSDSDPAVTGLEELIGIPEVQASIPELLEPIYRQNENWSRLADILEIRLNHTSREGQRLALLESLGEIHRDRIGDDDLAFAAWARIFAIKPDHPDARRELEDLALGVAAWRNLVSLYEAHVDGIEEDALRTSLRQTLADTCYIQLQEPTQAQTHYEALLDEIPDHAHSMAALEAIYADSSQWEALLGIHTRRLSATQEPSEQIEQLRRIEDIQADKLDLVDAAIDSCNAIIGIDSEALSHYRRLDALLTRAERWDELATNLTTQTILVDDTEDELMLQSRLAQVQENQLQDVDAAIETHARILDVDPEHADTIAVLERLFEAPETAEAVADLLEPVHHASGNWESLLRVHEAQKNKAHAPDDQVRYAFAMATLHEERGQDLQAAMGQYAEALRIQPENKKTVAELLRLADALDLHAAAVQLIGNEVDAIGDLDRQIAVHRTLAEVTEHKLNDPQATLGHHQAILDIQPDDVEAADALIRLHRGASSWDALVAALLDKAGHATDPSDQGRLLKEAGAIAADELADPERAIPIFETVLGNAPEDLSVLDSLESLYARTERHADIVDILLRKIDLSQEDAERKTLARQCADLQEGPLESPEDAIATHDRILEWDGEDREALDALDRLHASVGNAIELTGVLSRIAALTTPEERADLLLRKGAVLSMDIGDERAAIETYAAILNENAQEERALAALETIVTDGDEKETAFGILLPVLENNEAMQRAHDLIATMVPHREVAEGRIELLQRMAFIAEASLENPLHAFDCLGRALREDAAREDVTEELERIAKDQDHQEALQALYATVAEDVSDPGRALELQLRVGRILKERIADPHRAIPVFTTLMEDHPDNTEVLDALDTLHQVTGQWPELAGILRARIDVTTDGEERIGLHFRLATLLEESLSKPEEAFDAMQEVLFLVPAQEHAVDEIWRLCQSGVRRNDASEILEPIYTDQERWRELESLLKVRLEDLTDPVDKTELLLRLADLNTHQMNSPGEALSWLGKAFILDAEDDHLLSRMEENAEATQGWSALQEFLLAGAAESPKERKIELWHKASRVSLERHGAPEQAEELMGRILALDAENSDALEILDTLLTNDQRWEEVEPILESRIQLSEYDEEQVELLDRLGTLQRDSLERPEDAIQTFRRILAIDETHFPALQSLAALYESSQQWEPLHAIYETLGHLIEAPDKRGQILSRLAEILEQHLERPAEAIEMLEELLLVQPENREAMHDVQRLLSAAERWEDLAEALDREARLLEEDETQRRLEVHRMLGQLWSVTLDDPMSAQGHWEQVLALATTDLEALQNLQDIYRDSGAAEALAGVLQTLLEQEEDQESEGALAIWRELAELRHTALGQPHAAIDAWEMVSRIEPANEDALDALEQLHNEQSQWSDSVAIVQRRAALRDSQERPAEATEQLMRAAEIQLNQIENKDAAIALYETILEREPGHADASWQLESLCESGEDWPRLATVLLGRVEHTEDSDDVVPTLQKLAKIYEEKLEEVEGAFLVHQRVLQEDPDDILSLGEVWRLGESTQNNEGLANGLLETVPRMEDEHQQTETRMRLGALLRDHLERDEESVAQFQAVLEVQPDHTQALQSLVELYEPMERWEALVEALEALSEATAEYPERIRLMGRVGSVLEQRIQDADRAVKAYKDVLDLDESDSNALNALDRLHAERSEWRELLEVLELKIQADPNEEVALRLRMGRLLATSMEEAVAAIETFEEILHLDPTQPDALRELESLYQGREDWDGLIAVYERLQNASSDPETRKALARNIALIQEEIFSDPTRAAEAYREMLDADPTDADTVAALDRLLSVSEAWDELLNVLELHAENIHDNPAHMVQTLTRIAELHQHHLDDQDNAVRALERVLEHDDGHASALDALGTHYRTQERWPELSGILDRKIAHAEGEAQITLLCQKAALQADELSATADAITTLQAALDLQPSSREALQTLQRIHAMGSSWEEVVAALLLEEAVVPEGPEKAAVRMRVGRVHADYLNDNVNAIHYLESALVADPQFVDAAEPLAQLFAAEERWESIEPLLELLEGAAGEGEDSAIAASRFALVARAREGLMDSAGAFNAWTQAVSHAPDNSEYLWGMGRIALQRQSWDDARAHFENLIDLIRESASDTEMAECATALGEIALAQGRDTDATDHLEEAIALQPNNAAAISNLVQMAREHGNWQTVVRYQQELVELKDDPMERLALQLEIGDICKEHLDDLHGAVDAWRRALELDPAGRASLGKLLEVHLAQREFQDGVEILQRMIDTEEDTHAKANHTFMLALIHRDELKDDEQAVYFFNETLDLEPSRLEAFQALDDLLTKRQAWKEEERAYRKMIERIADKGNNELEFKLWKSLGDIYRLRLKDYEYAISAFHLASEKRPGDVQILEILSELQEKTNADPEALIHTHRRLVELEPDSRINSYRALYKLYRSSGNEDGAWCIASVLNGMGKADDDATSFHQENRTPTMALSSTPVDGDAWSRGILHSGAMDRVLGEIFQILFSVLGGSLRAQSLKDLQLQKSDAIDLEDGSMFANVFRTVAGLLDLQTPVVYSSERELGIRIENLDPPAIVIGNDLQSGRSEKELAFLVGKTLTYFLPLHLMAGIYSRSDLKMLFLAAMKSVRPDMDVGENADLMAVVDEINRRVTPTQRETLDTLITNVEVNQSDLQLGDWLESVELSANHAGLLMCNDFEVALNSIRSGALSMSKLGDGEKLKDLVVYAVSERYMGLRKRMGIAIESSES